MCECVSVSVSVCAGCAVRVCVLECRAVSVRVCGEWVSGIVERRDIGPD